MSKYDLYLRDIKNKYTTNNQQNNLGLSDAEIEAQASRAASNQVMKENQTLLKRDYSGLSNETNQISIDADINKIQWAEEYDEESLEWWDKVGAWISQAKNTLAETFIKMGTENLVDAGAIVGAMVADAMGNKDASENIRNFVKMDLTGDLIFNQDWYRQIDEKIFGEKASKFAYNDKATQDWVKKMSQSIGSMLGFAALWNIPYVGPGIAATSVGGASTEEALREGANAEQAFAYGLGSAAIESITELTVGKLLDFIGKGGSKVVNKIFKTNFSGKAANDVIAGIGKQYGKSILLNTLKDMNEEGVEEVVSSLLQPILQMIYKECDENDFFGKYGELFEENGGWQGILEDYFYAAASTGVMGGVRTAKRTAHYGSIKMVQFENSMANVTEKVSEIQEIMEENDFTKYPNIQDNPRYKKAVKELQFLQEKIGKDFGEYLDNIKAEFEKKVTERNVSKRLGRQAALVAASEKSLYANEQSIQENIGRDIVSSVDYNYKTYDEGVAKTKFSEQTVYVNGTQNFYDYVKTVMHEYTHIASKGDTNLSLVNAIVDSIPEDVYKKEFGTQLKLQVDHFLESSAGKQWLKDNKLTIAKYNRLSNKRKAEINEKIGKENKSWFDEEIAAEHLIDSFNSVKELKKVISNMDAKGIRKILTSIRKAFTSKKNKPSNYDKIITTLEDGIKRARADVIKSKETKFREVKREVDSDGNALTEEQANYFNNSKITDENGKLKIAYHSTNKDFYVFNKTNKFLSRSFQIFNIPNYWFSLDRTYSDLYGEDRKKIGNYKTQEFYLNVKNPLIIDFNDTNLDSKIRDKLHLRKNAKIDSDYINIYISKMVIDTSNAYSGKNGEAIGVKLNYDGVILKNVANAGLVEGKRISNKKMDWVISFEPNQIKLTTNQKPTDNEDVRYREVDSEGKELTEKQIERFENSQARDYNGNLQKSYHGTTFEFYTFDKKKASPEGNLGAGFYFSNKKKDAAFNYMDEETSPDLRNKIASLADQIQYNDEVDYEEAEKRAKALLVGGNPTTLEVYLDIQIPIIIGNDNDTRIFDYDEFMGTWEYTMEDFESEDDYFIQLDDEYFEDILSTVDTAIYDLDIDYDYEMVRRIANNIWEERGLTFERLRSILNNSYFDYLTDSNGNYMANEVARKIVEVLGFDGIIDYTVSDKFQGMNLDADTIHYVVFNSNQIKRTDNKNPTYDDDIRYRETKESKILKRWTNNESYTAEENEDHEIFERQDEVVKMGEAEDKELVKLADKYQKKIFNEYLKPLYEELRKEKDYDKQKIVNLYYSLMHSSRVLFDLSEDIDLASSRAFWGQFEYNLVTLAKAINFAKGNIERLDIRTRPTNRIVMDETAIEETKQAKIDYEFDRASLEKELKKQNVNVEEINNEAASIREKLKVELDKVRKYPNPKKDRVKQERYETIVEPIDTLISVYTEYLNRTNLSEKNIKEAIEYILDDIYGGKQFRTRNQRWIEKIRRDYNNISLSVQDAVQNLVDSLSPQPTPQATQEQRVRIINNSRKIAMPEIAGIKAQADLRVDGRVYSLTAVNDLTKLIETSLKNEPSLINNKFAIEFEDTTREIKATEIAMILNEYNNSQYVKHNEAINYSNLSDVDKVDKITKIYTDGITFEVNGNKARLKDYIAVNDSLAMFIKEYIKVQVEDVVENKGNPSKIKKILERQTRLYVEKINSLSEKTLKQSQRIVSLKERLARADVNTTEFEKLQKEMEKIRPELDERRKQVNDLLKQTREQSRRIRNLENQNERLKESRDYYYKKNIELTTDAKGIRKITVESVNLLQDLGKNINPDFVMSNYVSRQIADFVSRGKFEQAVEIYMNALLRSDYVDGDVVIPFEEVVAMQQTIFADEYLEEGEQPNHFLQDMEIIKYDLMDIFNGAEISSKTKMLKRLSRLYVYIDNIRSKLRDTTKNFRMFKAASSTKATSDRVYKRLIDKNEKGLLGKSGNRYGGLDPEFVEAIRNFAKGEIDKNGNKIKGFGKLKPIDIVNGEFLPALKLFDERYSKLEARRLVNFYRSDALNDYIAYLLDDNSPRNVGYIRIYQKVLNGVNRLVEEEVKTRQEKFGDIQDSIANISQRMQDENNEMDREERFGFEMGFLTPTAVFDKLSGYNRNSVFWQMYVELVNSEMKRQSANLDLRKPFDEFEKNKEAKAFYKSLSKEVEIKYQDNVIKGEKGQLLSLYEAFKREQSLEHITNRLGGIEINGQKTTFNNFAELQTVINKIAEMFNLNDANSIDAKFLKASETFFRKARQYKYDVDMIRWGFSNIEDGFYFPITIADSDKQISISNEDYFKTSLPGAANYSWNKNVVSNMGAIKLNNILNIIKTHINQTSIYAGYGVVADNIQKLWNYKLEQGKTVAQAVKGRFNYETGFRVERYIANLLNDVQGIGGKGGSTTDSIFKKIVGRLRGSVATVSLGANPKVMFSQIASIPAALKYIKGRYLLRALKSGFGIGIGNGKIPPKPDMFIYRQRENHIAQAETQGAIDITKNILSKGINAFDTYAINVIWKASLLQTRIKNADGSYSWDIDAATQLAQQTVFETQPNYLALGRSEFLRSKNDLVKMFTMFQSQAQQNLSMAYTAIERIAYKKKHKIPVSKEDWDELAHSLIALLMQGILYSGIGQLFKHFLYNDWQDVKPQTETVDFSVKFFNDNVMGMIPLINNIELDLSSNIKVNFDNLRVGWLDSFTELIKGIDGNITMKEVATNFSYITGVPLTNVYKWTKALAQYVPGAKDYVEDFDAIYRGAKITKQTVNNAKTPTLTRTYYRQYTEANTSLSKDTIKELYGLYSKGYKNVIVKSIPSTITLNGEEIKVNSKEFNEVYGNLGNALERMIGTNFYVLASDEEKSKIIEKMINLYYSASRKNISGETMNILEKIVYYNKDIDAKTLLSIIEANDIEADEKKTKKQNVEKYINSLRLTKANKYFIYNAIGYKTDPSLYKAYLVNLKLTRTQINMVVA